MTMCFWAAKNCTAGAPTTLCGRFDYQLMTGKWGFEALFLMISARIFTLKRCQMILISMLKHSWMDSNYESLYRWTQSSCKMGLKMRLFELFSNSVIFKDLKLEVWFILWKTIMNLIIQLTTLFSISILATSAL